MRNRSLDLLAAAAVGLGAAVAVWLGAPVAVTSALGIPLVLVAPGYVWAEVLFGSRLSAQLRAALSVSLSLVVTAAGGVLLYAAGVRLDRSSWVTLLACTTLAGAAAAAILRAGSGEQAAARVPRQRRVQAPSLTQGVRLTLAGLIGATALGVAVHSANAQVQPAFTALSLSQAGSAAGTAQVMVGNHEHGPASYRLVVSTDGVISSVWTATVADGASWARPVPATPGHRLAVDLYRSASGAKPYRHVVITFAAVGAK